MIGLFLGTLYVPLFFIATTIGKVSNMLINPIVTVLLSYEVDNDHNDDSARLGKTFKLIILVSVVISIIISIISWIFIFIFYNGYLNQVKGIIFLANLGVILMSSSAILQLKLVANSLFKQNLIINIVTLIIIFLLSLMLTKIFNIYGYAIALIIAAIFKHFAVYNRVLKVISSEG
ncbi:hypothetical protein BUZ17_12250 [Staphylococcus borealis]|nr:hypothetical protein BUZ17_12250 [Staphylococcus borealis]